MLGEYVRIQKEFEGKISDQEKLDYINSALKAVTEIDEDYIEDELAASFFT